MTVTIRDAKPDEADALSALALRSKAHWGYAEEFIAACVDELTLTRRDIEKTIVRVGNGGDGLAGYYQLVIEDDVAEVEHLFVAPEAIGGGLGRTLWADLTARAEDLERGGAGAGAGGPPPRAAGHCWVVGMREPAMDRDTAGYEGMHWSAHFLAFKKKVPQKPGFGRARSRPEDIFP